MRKFALLLAVCLAPLQAAKTFDIYVIDVEGGQATLMLTPGGQSVLVDAGWAGFNNRDADRIASTAKRAGVRQIDFLVVTHYHADHVGGVAPLADRIPILNFVTHGPNTETGKSAQALSEAFEKAMVKGRSIVVKPGDTLPIRGVDFKVVSSGGELMAPGGNANPLCAASKSMNPDPTENARSVGLLVTFGKFRFLDLGDLTWNKELEMACPNNRLGEVDVYLTTHHGSAGSGPATLVHALRPRVAIMNNGAKKGATPEAWQVVRASPGLEDLWQLHYAVAGGKDNNVTDPFIANLDENCEGQGLKLSAEASGAFQVTNARNKFQKGYKPRKS